MYVSPYCEYPLSAIPCNADDAVLFVITIFEIKIDKRWFF